MSGEEWKDSSQAVEERNDSDVQDHIDDDFGEFEGFDDVDEIGASVAQPLPESLQANWASFPDYVPSQHTMSSALQPDLLPMQASLNDSSQLDSSESSRIEQDLSSLDISSGGNSGPADVTCHESNRSIISSDLPDVSPPHRTYPDSSILELPLVQPDLAGPDFQRNSSNPLQSLLPDISPQTQTNGHGLVAEFPDISPVLNSLPDVSPMANRGIHSLDLPSCSRVHSMLPFSLGNVTANSSSSSSQNTLTATSGDVNLLQRVSATMPSPSRSQAESGASLNEIQEQVHHLQQQNERLVQEICEIKERNEHMHQMLSECLSFVHKLNSPPKENSNPTLENEMRHLTGILVELKEEIKKEKKGAEAVAVSDLQNVIVTFKEDIETKCTEQRECLNELNVILSQHKSNMQIMKKEIHEELWHQLDARLQLFQQQTVDIIRKSFQENSGSHKHPSEGSISAVEKAVEAFMSYMEEQKKREEQSISVFTILDSVLLNTHRQIQDLLNPKDCPNS